MVLLLFQIELDNIHINMWL